MLRLACAAQATGGMGRRAAARLASLQQLRPLQATAADQQVGVVACIASEVFQQHFGAPPPPPPLLPALTSCAPVPLLQAPEQAAPRPQYELVVSLADFDLRKVRLPASPPLPPRHSCLLHARHFLQAGCRSDPHACCALPIGAEQAAAGCVPGSQAASGQPGAPAGLHQRRAGGGQRAAAGAPLLLLLSLAVLQVAAAGAPVLPPLLLALLLPSLLVLRWAAACASVLLLLLLLSLLALRWAGLLAGCGHAPFRPVQTALAAVVQSGPREPACR